MIESIELDREGGFRRHRHANRCQSWADALELGDHMKSCVTQLHSVIRAPNGPADAGLELGGVSCYCFNTKLVTLALRMAIVSARGSLEAFELVVLGANPSMSSLSSFPLREPVPPSARARWPARVGRKLDCTRPEQRRARTTSQPGTRRPERRLASAGYGGDGSSRKAPTVLGCCVCGPISLSTRAVVTLSPRGRRRTEQTSHNYNGQLLGRHEILSRARPTLCVCPTWRAPQSGPFESSSAPSLWVPRREGATCASPATDRLIL